MGGVQVENRDNVQLLAFSLYGGVSGIELSSLALVAGTLSH